MDPRALARREAATWSRLGRDQVACFPQTTTWFKPGCGRTIRNCSEALRIDVDDRREPRAAHRGRRRGQERRRARGERAGTVGLADELCAVAGAQTQERRRAEQLVPAEARLQLLEDAHRVAELRPGDDETDEVPEGRVAELAPAVELAREEARHVVTRRIRDRASVRLERLHDHASRRVAAAASGQLRQELEGALLRAEVRQTEPGVGVDDGCELDAGEVMSLRDHLRADEHRALGAREPLERVAELLGLLDRVRVEPDPLEFGNVPLELTLELLRAGADPREVGRSARGARLPHRLVEAA